MNGQAIKQDFYVLRPAVTDKPVVQEAYNPGCQFYLPALAEYEPTDDHFNDKHSVIWFFDELFSDVKIYLQKLDGDWEDVAELTPLTEYFTNSDFSLINFLNQRLDILLSGQKF
jgi:hypothetical protein